jgi:hypothetical protein
VNLDYNNPKAIGRSDNGTCVGLADFSMRAIKCAKYELLCLDFSTNTCQKLNYFTYLFADDQYYCRREYWHYSPFSCGPSLYIDRSISSRCLKYDDYNFETYSFLCFTKPDDILCKKAHAGKL